MGKWDVVCAVWLRGGIPPIEVFINSKRKLFIRFSPLCMIATTQLKQNYQYHPVSTYLGAPTNQPNCTNKKALRFCRHNFEPRLHHVCPWCTQRGFLSLQWEPPVLPRVVFCFPRPGMDRRYRPSPLKVVASPPDGVAPWRVVGVGYASPNSGEFRGVWQTPKEESRGLHGGGGLFWHGETVKHEWTSLGTLIFVGVFFSQAFTILSKSST